MMTKQEVKERKDALRKKYKEIQKLINESVVDYGLYGELAMIELELYKLEHKEK